MVGPLLLIGLLTWPLLFTDEGFTGEWVNHLWLTWDQSLSIRENLYPSFFLVTYHHSIFYPEFAFYGGTLKTIFGALSLLLGNAPVVAYVASYLFGFAASYGGWYWLARMAGLGRLWANAPGVVFVTSAYYLTLIYERGDWPEFMAVSMIPLMLASALSILRGAQLHLGPALALVASGVIFGGSHPLTLVWGSSVIALTCLLAAAFIPEARRLVSRRGAIRVGTLFAAALLVSAWSLLPAVAYESHTFIASHYQGWRLVLSGSQSMVAADRIFTLSRGLAKRSVIELALALPVLAMAWSLVSAFAFPRRGLRGPWERLLLICAGIAALMTIAMTHTGIVLALPRPYAMIEFPYRLESYVILATSAAVLVGLVLAQRARSRTRYWAWALIPALAVGIVGAIQQTAAYPAYGGRQQAIGQHLKPGPREEGLLDYQDARLQLLQYTHEKTAPEIDFPLASVHDNHVSMVVHLKPGLPVYSNVGGGPELVHVTGAKIIGLTPHGNDILQIGASVGGPKPSSGGGPKRSSVGGPKRSSGGGPKPSSVSGPKPSSVSGPKPSSVSGPKRSSAGNRASPWTEVISVSTADGLPIVLGRVLSFGALLFLAGGLALSATRRIRAALTRAAR